MTINSPTGETFVILVDENDKDIGVMEKMEVHRKGLLHRAVSVFITNSQGDWILQRRARNKYHSNGLWTNTCCSHPYQGETSAEAARRRLMEEMGLDCELKEIFSFIYKETLDNELTEHELDHIFVGTTDDLPKINREEVDEWKAVPYNDLHDEMTRNPDLYTIWFRKLYERVNDQMVVCDCQR
ncbi:MAG TPA: isopentenyl-diphosphate Delta-isomerase [Prolixibacteraceae bacterium]|jgi:isopentenyl-diphosphate delta-isomerase